MGELIDDSANPPPKANPPPNMSYVRLGRAIIGDPREATDVRLFVYPPRGILQEMRHQVADMVQRRYLRKKNVRIIMEFQWLVEHALAREGMEQDTPQTEQK